MKEEELKANFAKNLYSLRKNKNLSQAQLANDLNYTHKAISKWENKETLPDITTFSVIADYFGITVDDLISDKKVVNKVNKEKQRRRVVLSSIAMCFVITAIVYSTLVIVKMERSYIAIPFAAFMSSVVFLIFSCLWFKKHYVFLAITGIIWSVALIVMLFLNFEFYYLILIICGITNIAFFPFLRLIYANRQ